MAKAQVDNRSLFDTLDQGQLRAIFRKRVQDGVVLHLIGSGCTRA